MSLRKSNSKSLSCLLKRYLSATNPIDAREYAQKIKNLTGYEGISDLYTIEDSIHLENDFTTGNENVISPKTARLIPGTKKEDFPVFIVTASTVTEDSDIDMKCEEIIISRKSEQYDVTLNYNMDALLALPQSVPNLVWYFCIMKDVLRDCQELLVLVTGDNCRDRCPRMNASDDIEYLCSCHPKTCKCSAVDYFYHNINFNTLRVFSLQAVLNRNDKHSQDPQKEISGILRRLYRLYLHAYFQHFSAFVYGERHNHYYEKFYTFVSRFSLLSEKDMKPYLSLDDMKASVYQLFD